MAENNYLGEIAGSASESDRLARENKARRLNAEKSNNSVILNNSDLHGDYDATRVLTTTLGGVPRNITVDDLIAFKKNIKTTQSKFKAGITARQVMDLSLQIDRDRAKEQITMASPTYARSGVIRFITNASKESKDTRHHVNVELLSYNAAVNSNKTVRNATNWLRKQPIKIECDCGRFTYWYRYVATIGSFNYGRNETGFPKIRNPKLTGVACKHLLRVMSELEKSVSVQLFIDRLITKARKDSFGNVNIKSNQKEIEKTAKNQQRRTSGNKIKTSADLASERDRRKIKQALKNSKKPKKETKASRRKNNQIDEIGKIVGGKLTPEQIEAIRRLL